MRLADLDDGSIERRLPGRNPTKADIVVYRLGARRIAVKDYRPRSPWMRATLGRWLVARECAAYAAAAGVPGIARFLGRLGPHTLATEWFDGLPLARWAEAPPPSCFERLRRTLDELHRRGVALGDLHRRDVLVAVDGEVEIVDLATAVSAGPGAGPLARALFRKLRRQDEIAFARLRATYTGGDADAAVRALGSGVWRAHRRARRAKRWIARLRGA